MMGCSAFLELQHYWNLTIRLFNVVIRTLFGRLSDQKSYYDYKRFKLWPKVSRCFVYLGQQFCPSFASFFTVNRGSFGFFLFRSLNCFDVHCLLISVILSLSLRITWSKQLQSFRHDNVRDFILYFKVIPISFLYQVWWHFFIDYA